VAVEGGPAPSGEGGAGGEGGTGIGLQDAAADVVADASVLVADASACGGPGQACCAGGTCASAMLACNSGACAFCGGVGGPCCMGNVCGAGLACASGACTADAGAGCATCGMYTCTGTVSGQMGVTLKFNFAGNPGGPCVDTATGYSLACDGNIDDRNGLTTGDKWSRGDGGISISGHDMLTCPMM
jgi:hypothetical protein